MSNVILSDEPSKSIFKKLDKPKNIGALHENGKKLPFIGRFVTPVEAKERTRTILKTVLLVLLTLGLALFREERRYHLFGKKIVHIYKAQDITTKKTTSASENTLSSSVSSSSKSDSRTKSSSKSFSNSKTQLSASSELNSKDTLINTLTAEEFVETFFKLHVIEVSDEDQNAGDTDEESKLDLDPLGIKLHLDSNDYKTCKEGLLSVENIIRDDLSGKKGQHELSELDPFNSLTYLTGIKLSYNHQQLKKHFKQVFKDMKTDGMLISASQFSTMNSSGSYTQASDRICLDQLFAYLSLKKFMQSRQDLSHLKLFDVYVVVDDGTKEIDLEVELPYRAPYLRENCDRRMKIYFKLGEAALALTEDERDIFINEGKINLTKLVGYEPNSSLFPMTSIEAARFQSYCTYSELEFVKHCTVSFKLIRAFLEYRFMNTQHITPVFLCNGILKLTIPI